MKHTAQAKVCGVAFVDDNEIWYLETGTGHQWMAQRIPEDVYFGSGNQGRLRLYDPNASEFKGSPDLIDFASDTASMIRRKVRSISPLLTHVNDDRDRVYNDPARLADPEALSSVCDSARRRRPRIRRIYEARTQTLPRRRQARDA